MRALANLGLIGFFDLGEDGWDDEMSLNLLTLSVLVQGTVLGIVPVEPGAPADKAVYVLDEAHATQPNKVAVYDVDTWKYLAGPVAGWRLYDANQGGFIEFNGARWVASGHAEVEDIAGDTYTLVMADAANKYKRATSGTGCAITVPPEADVDFPLGSLVTIRGATAAAVSLVAGAGVTLNLPGGAASTLVFAETHTTVQLKKVAADVWDVIGNMAAA